MNFHLLQGPASAELGRALEQFETQFCYPLGEGASFSISHGQDYVTFFAAMGEPTVIVAEHDGQVQATLSASLRPLRRENGQMEQVVYLGDLKVAPAARGGTVLARLLTRLRNHYQGLATSGYGVVMDGTGRTPFQYTGRLGLPAFTAVASLLILAIETPPPTGPLPVVSQEVFDEFQRRLTPPGILPCGGTPKIRSELPPTTLAIEGSAALLEDTRRAKRLFLSPTQEMRAAHLSQLVFEHPKAAADLIRQAAGHCNQLGIPTLFACLPAPRAQAVVAHLDNLTFQPAPATVFAHGFPEGLDWWIDTAEI